MLNILIQVLFPITLSFSSAASAAMQENIQKQQTSSIISWNKNDPPQENADVAQMGIQAGRILSDENSSSATKNYLFGIANGKVTEEIKNWLSGIGHADVKLNVDEKLSLKNSQFGLLVPFFDYNDGFVFTQKNLHYTDDRSQLNIGLGWRHFNDDYLFGANSFFDYDISRGHQRIGLGAEYWRNYFKLSSNLYRGLSSWKDSPDFEDTEERAADGWDIRMQGYLPSWPNLGGALTYEKYYGDSVALFGKQKRYKDPHAITAELSYTPFPLLTFNAEHKRGSDTDSRIGMQLSYHAGMTWEQHLDSSNVAGSRNLMGSRYDLVDRNNNIILEYRKKQVISLQMAKNISGYAGQQLPLNVSVNSKHGFATMEWQAADFIAQGGSVTETSPGQYSVTLPDFNHTQGASNAYEIAASALDNKGNRSNSATVRVTVQEPALNQQYSSIVPQQATLPADGKSSQTFTISIKDETGKPIDVKEDELSLYQENGTRAPDTVTFTAFSRQSEGVYSITATSGVRPYMHTLTPVARGKKLATAKLELVADISSATIRELTISSDEALANGVDTKTVSAKVADALGHPVIDTEVTFSADNSANLASSVVKTNDQGIASTTLSTLHVGIVSVTAKIDRHTLSKQTVFYGDDSTATLVSLTPSAPPYIADGHTPVTWSAVVEDKSGNLLPGVRVVWRSDRDDSIVKFSETESSTDADGVARTQITSTRALDATVTALANGTFITAPPITFEANTAQRHIASVSADYQQIVANDRDSAMVTARVEDNHGNIIKDAKVQWSVSPGGRVEAVSSMTDANGDAQIKVFATQSGSIDVTAKIDNDSKSYSLRTIGDEQSAAISLTTEGDKKTATADGNDAITFIAQLTDSMANPLINVPVSWSSSHNNLSAWSTLTDDEGKARVSLAGTQAGAVEVSATTANNAKQSLGVNFIASSPAVIHSHISVYPQTIVAGGEAATVTVILQDQYGNPVNGQSLEYGSSDAANIHFTNQIAAGDGRYQAKVNATKEGTFDVKATVNGMAPLTAKLGVIASAETAQLASVVVVPPDTVNANGSDRVILRVQVKDSNNNTSLPGVSVGWQTTLGSLASPISMTNAQGIAEITLSSVQAGIAQVSARLGDTTMPADKTISFLAGNVSSQQSGFTLSPASIIAEDENTNLTVRAKDAQGNALTGLASTITVSYVTDLQMTAATFTEVSAGVYQAQVTGKRAGETTVTAHVGGTSLDQQATLTLKANPASWRIDTLSVNRSTFVAGDSSGALYSAQVLDGNDNPLSNAVVSWQLMEGKATSFERSSRTNAQGIASTRLLSETAGNIVMEAWLDNNNNKRAPTVVVSAGEVDVTRSSLTTDKSTIGADGVEAATLTATLADRFGNPVTGKTVNMLTTGALSTFAINPNPLEEKGNGLYQAKATSTTKGDETVSARVGSVTLNEKVLINVGSLTPDLRFDNALQRVTYTRNFTESQAAQGIPAGAKQQWSSSDASVASVDSNTGKITLLQAGRATITLQTGSSDQYLPAMASYQIQVERADPGLSTAELSIDAHWNDGVIRSVKGTFTNSDASGLKPVYNSSDNQIVAVDSDGLLTMVKPGNMVSISLSTEQTPQFNAARVNVVVNLRKGTSTIMFSEPELKVRSSSGSVVLPVPVLSTNINVRDITWTSSNRDLGTINNSSFSLSGDVGQSVIAAVFAENDYYLSSRGEFILYAYGVPQVNVSEVAYTSMGEKAISGDWRPVFTSDGVTVSFVLEGDAKTRPAKNITAELSFSSGVPTQTKSLSGSDIQYNQALSFAFSAPSNTLDSASSTLTFRITDIDNNVEDAYSKVVSVSRRTTNLNKMVNANVRFAQQLWDTPTVPTHVCSGDDVATLNANINVTAKSDLLTYYRDALRYRAYLKFVSGENGFSPLDPSPPDKSDKGMVSMTTSMNLGVPFVQEATYSTSGDWSLSYSCWISTLNGSIYRGTYQPKLVLSMSGIANAQYTSLSQFTWEGVNSNGSTAAPYQTFTDFQ